MSEFILLLKAKDGCQRFFFMTGTTKVSCASMFLGFNLLDITLDPAYGTLLGFAEKELHDHFEPHISRAAKSLNTTQDDILEKLKATCGGYCFDEAASTQVSCPWSVLHFLTAPNRAVANDWPQTSGLPRALLNYLAQEASSRAMTFGQTKEVRLSHLESADPFESLEIDVLFAQLGLFTIKSVGPDGFAVLGCPNQGAAILLEHLRDLAERRGLE